MHEARFVGLEGLGRARGAVRHRQARVPASAQQPIQRRAAHRGFDKLAHYGQQIIERQPQRRAQINHPCFLCRVQRGLQALRGVGGVLHALAPAPLADRVAAHTELPRQFIVTARGLLDRRRGRRILMQGDQPVGFRPFHSATMTPSTLRLISNGRLVFSRYSSGT